MKKRRERSIQSTLSVWFIISIIVPIVLIDIVSFFFLRRSINDNYFKEIENVIQSLDENMVIYFEQLESQIELMSVSDELREFLTLSETCTQMEEVTLYKEASAYINKSVGGRTDTGAISIYDLDGNLVLSRNTNMLRSTSEESANIIQQLKGLSYGCHYFGAHKYGSGSTCYLTLGSKIMDLNGRQEIGYVIVDLNYNTLEKIASWKNISGQFLVLLNNQIVYDSTDFSMNTEQLSAEYLYSGGGSSVVKEYSSDKSGWGYVVIADRPNIYTQIYTILLILLTVSGICFFIFFTMTRRISRKIVANIHGLEESMQQAEENNFNKIAAVNGNTFLEIRNLYSRFNVMQIEILAYMDKRKEWIRKKADMEYQALQMQITPHFLYNSLDSINCLAQIYGKEDISEMIISLAQIFKYSTRNTGLQVELCQEIRHVQDYCMLQAVRYQGKFRVEIAVDSRYNHLKVIKFMLQPLVENAIQHGVGKMRSGGLIRIGIEERPDTWCIFVWDNAGNFDPETLEKYRRLFQEEPQETEEAGRRKSIGLYNVYCRLKFVYGDAAGIRIDVLNGTTIELIFPKEDENVPGIDCG